MGIKLTFPRLIIVAIVVAGLIFGAGRVLTGGEADGSLLLAMVFWLAAAEGCVALMAAAEVAHATWHRPLLTRMLSAHAMVLAMGAVFLVFVTQLDIYPWNDGHGRWLTAPLFIGRHALMLLIVFLAGRKFAADTLRGVASKRRWGVIYILLFVSHQTLVGTEWVMSLEKPWFSTLFGAWFMVSAFLSAICVGAILLYSWRARFDDALRYAQKSIGGLMFGFATFWAYFYFSQLIVIWYGNLPEEVAYLARRIGYHTPYWLVARLIFALCWVIPFAVLMGRKPKIMPSITLAMALTIMTGFVLQYWLTIHPAVNVNPLLAAIHFVLIGFLFASVIKSSEELLPAGGLASVEASATATAHH